MEQKSSTRLFQHCTVKQSGSLWTMEDRIPAGMQKKTAVNSGYQRGSKSPGIPARIQSFKVPVNFLQSTDNNLQMLLGQENTNYSSPIC